MPLAASPSTGAAGALFAEIQDSDLDHLSIVAVRSIDDQGIALSQDWRTLTNTNETIQGLYGNFTLKADGSYKYEVNDQLSALASLNDGQQLKDFFRLKVSDGQADPIDQDIVVTINGRDEVAKPSIDVVSTDDRLNRSERRNGITLTGSAPGASNVAINWGSTQKQAAVVNGRWAATFSTTIDPKQTNPLLATVSEVPDDWQDGTIRISATDAIGQKSLSVERKIIIDTVLPTMPQLNLVAGDNQVNASEKENGIALSGMAEAGSTVSIVWGSTRKTALVNSKGEWTIPLAPNEIGADGLRSNIKLTSTDLAGNVSLTKNDFVKTVDTQLPATVTVDPITDDNVINLAEFSKGIAISGSTERSTTIQLAWGNFLFKPFVSASGKWSQAITANQMSQLNRTAPILITVTDSAGNSSTNPPISPQFDLDAPTAPVLVPVGKSLNGKQVVNAATKATGLIVKGQAGSAEAGSTVSITLGRTQMNTKAAADGSWQMVLAADALPADTEAIQLQAIATDVAGNQSPISSQTLLIDTEAPKEPKILAVTGDDFITGTEATSGITLQGTAEAGTGINVLWSGLQWSSITSADGKWKQGVTSGELAKLGSTGTIAIQATDQAGNTSGVTSRSIKLALTVANAPKFDKISGDDKINQSEAKAGVSISGKAEADSIIKITLGGTVITTTTDPSGIWKTLLRSSSLPQNDGTYQLIATATNSSGIDSSTESRTITLDRTTPTLQSSVLSGNQIRLLYSEDLDIHNLSTKDFTVLEGQSTLTIAQATVSQNNPRLVELSLNREPPSISTLSISYSPSSSNGISSVTDGSGNAAVSFSKFSPSSLESNQSVAILADQYRELKLIGISAINGVGNIAANKLTGNQANNVLEGGGGADILTGLGGADMFRYTKLTDSLLTGFDQITDFAVGTDKIDGPNSVGSTAILNAGQATDLTEAALQKILPSVSFVANGAATFTFGSRTFLTINDSSAGFSSSRDAVIEITGYSGNLQNLAIV
jgi:VCBS repeat-containing protein